MSNFYDYAKNALLLVLSAHVQDAFLPTSDGPRSWGQRKEKRDAKSEALFFLGIALADEVAALDNGDITKAQPGQLDAIVQHLLAHVRTFPMRTAAEIDRIRAVFLGQFDPTQRSVALSWYLAVYRALEQVCLAKDPLHPDWEILEHLVVANTKALLKAFLKRTKKLVQEYQDYQIALIQYVTRQNEPLPFFPEGVLPELPNNAIIDLTNMQVDLPDNMQVDLPELSSHSSENDLILWSKMNRH